MADEELQRLYIPVTQSRADAGSMLTTLVENACAYGPVYEIVVHESDGWRAVRDSDDLAGGLVRMVPAEEVRTFEKRAEHFLKPFIEILAPEQGDNEVPINVYRPMRNVLVEFQIAANYRCALGTDGAFLDSSRVRIQEIRTHRELVGTPTYTEIMARLDALDTVIKAYSDLAVDGVRFVPAGLDRCEALAALDDEMFKALSRSKWSLALTDSPLATKHSRIAAGVQGVLDSKWSKRVTRSADVLSLVTGVGLPPFLEASRLLADYLAGVKLDRFAPALVDDAPYSYAPNHGVVASQRYGWEFTFRVQRNAK